MRLDSSIITKLIHIFFSLVIKKCNRKKCEALIIIESHAEYNPSLRVNYDKILYFNSFFLAFTFYFVVVVDLILIPTKAKMSKVNPKPKTKTKTNMVTRLIQPSLSIYVLPPHTPRMCICG